MAECKLYTQGNISSWNVRGIPSIPPHPHTQIGGGGDSDRTSRPNLARVAHGVIKLLENTDECSGRWTLDEERLDRRNECKVAVTDIRNRMSSANRLQRVPWFDVQSVQC
jgi:hypothetical protein